jgi:hypothetical protein
MNVELDLHERKKQKELEDKIEKQPVPITNNRIAISGIVVSIKLKYNDYTGEDDVKLVILDDRGFKVWGSEPTIRNENDDRVEVEKGDKIEFMAKVTASNNDKYFGFYKRPTKAKHLSMTIQSRKEVA